MIRNFIKDQLKVGLLVFSCFVVEGYLFWAASLPVSIYVYMVCLELFLFLVYLCFSWLSVRRRLHSISSGSFTSSSPVEQELYSQLESVSSAYSQSVLAQRRALREKENLYAMWVHQNKLPISAMKLLLDSDVPDIRQMKIQLHRMEQYTQMVLAVSRMESAETDYAISSFALDPVIRNVVRDFVPEMVSRHLSFTYDGCPDTVLSDSKWLSFVLTQILSNAVKYASSSVSISVSSGVLSVSDDGPGISVEDQMRIFTRGTTGLNGRSNMESTGLGLYLSQRILAALNHKIWIESSPGSGTKVCISLVHSDLEVE